ncbi:EAL domain-containing protein [Rhodoferax sp. 4810]|nr:EAL domain-containing protein [Rhodoferax jenense]
MHRDDILPVLYDLAVTIGSELSLQPLLKRTLQRVLYYTSFPAGFICLNPPAPCDTSDTIPVTMDAAVGDFDLLGQVGQPLQLPRALLDGSAVSEADQATLLANLPGVRTRYTRFLPLPIPGQGVVLLLAPVLPSTGLPLAQVFEPVMAHLANAITLCRSNDANTDALRAERNLFAEVFVNSSSGVVITDPQQAIVAINPAFTQITGYSLDDVRGKMPSVLASRRHDAAFYKLLWDSIHANGHWQGELWDRRKNGEEYPEWINISAVHNTTGTLTHYVGIFSDISRSKEAEAQIHQLAYFDSLTDLPNRHLFQSRVNKAGVLSSRNRQHGAILVLDLDHFKNINDAKGPTLGDQLLREVASRLRQCIQGHDTLARLGGDEFGILLEGLSTLPAEAASEAEQLAEQLRQALSEPFTVAEQAYYIKCSTGVVIFLGWGNSADDLLKHADAAMHQAKTAGRNTIRFYDPQMQSLIEARADLESALHKALAQQEFQLFYQIQVDSLGRPLGAEALLRWLHPERGVISPAQFIPLAEETGLILPIGLWVIQTACAQLARWQAAPLLRDLVLAVNVSARQFGQPDFVKQVQRAMRDNGIKPSHLKLELTESTVLINVEETVAKMRELRLQGVSFSLDDFGTGHSSLAYLKRLPLDQIKIDQSFVQDITHDPNDCAIVQAIIAVTEALGLNVIAEGVETEEQRQLLEQRGCHAFQGYLFGRPAPLNEFSTLLNQTLRQLPGTTLAPG